MACVCVCVFHKNRTRKMYIICNAYSIGEMIDDLRVCRILELGYVFCSLNVFRWKLCRVVVDMFRLNWTENSPLHRSQAAEDILFKRDPSLYSHDHYIVNISICFPVHSPSPRLPLLLSFVAVVCWGLLRMYTMEIGEYTGKGIPTKQQRNKPHKKHCLMVSIKDPDYIINVH